METTWRFNNDSNDELSLLDALGEIGPLYLLITIVKTKWNKIHKVSDNQIIYWKQNVYIIADEILYFSIIVAI